MRNSKLKALLRTIVAWLYYYSGGFALHLYWQRRQKRNVLILTFHRVLPEHSPVLQNHLSLRSIIVTQENFRRLLAFLKKHFAFSALQHLALQNGAGSQTTCVLTFDDGYHDFSKHAWPIMRRMNVTATMFLPTALVGTTHSFWWDELYHLAMKLERVSINGVDDKTRLLLQHIAETPFSERAEPVYHLIDFLQDWPQDNVKALITHLEEQQSCKTQHWREENKLLTWEEVEALHADGVQFGSHTRHHLNLAALSRESLYEEVASSKSDLELKLNAPVKTFAFPGGHFSEAALNAVAQSGYALACSTMRGFNRAGEDRFRLRRINMWDGMLQDFRGRFSTAVFALNLMRSNL